MCSEGDDSIVVTKEPSTSADACIFVFTVDSSVVCAAKNGGVGGDSLSNKKGGLFSQF